MADVIEGRLEASNLKRSLRDVRRSVYKGLRAEMRAIGRDFKADFASSRLSGPPGIKGRPSLIRSTVRGSRITNLLLRIGFKPRFIGVHEKGATIKAKRAFAALPGGPYLRVPLSVTRSERRRKASFINTFIGRGRGGQFIVYQRTATGEVRPLYALKKEITLPPRLQFFPAWRKGLNLVLRRIQTALHNAMAHSFGKAPNG